MRKRSRKPNFIKLMSAANESDYLNRPQRMAGIKQVSTEVKTRPHLLSMTASSVDEQSLSQTKAVSVGGS